MIILVIHLPFLYSQASNELSGRQQKLEEMRFELEDFDENVKHLDVWVDDTEYKLKNIKQAVAKDDDCERLIEKVQVRERWERGWRDGEGAEGG